MRFLRGLCAVLPLFCACIGGSVGTLKPTGEQASVLLRDEREMKGELLCLGDTSLCMIADGRIVHLPLASIEEIQVPDFDNRDTKAAAGLPMILLDILMMGSFSGNGEKTGPILFGASALLLGYSIATRSPNSLFSRPFDGETLERLSLFCRYPAGLTGEQWQTLSGHGSSGSTGPPSSNP
jgi:hypothetical protein